MSNAKKYYFINIFKIKKRSITTSNSKRINTGHFFNSLGLNNHFSKEGGNNLSAFK